MSSVRGESRLMTLFWGDSRPQEASLPSHLLEYEGKGVGCSTARQLPGRVGRLSQLKVPDISRGSISGSCITGRVSWLQALAASSSSKHSPLDSLSAIFYIL